MILYRPMTHADVPAAAAIEATVADGWCAQTLHETLQAAANRCFVAVAAGDAMPPCAGESAPHEGSAGADSLTPRTGESVPHEGSAGADSPTPRTGSTGGERAASTGGEICAFCAWSLVADAANLDALSVAFHHRRAGIGRGLLCFSIEVLRREGAARLWLEARCQNAPALALYTQLGFIRNGFRRGFYTGPPDDAVLMEKVLEKENLF
ncbi:MAG: GNAT family N-acetyltransferase [Ruthenibacterium sp.]